MTRRHTIAFGSCEPAASTPSIRFLRNLKQVNIETTSAEVVKLLRRQQKMRMRIMGSKSATNLLSGATVLTVASDPTGGSLGSSFNLFYNGSIFYWNFYGEREFTIQKYVNLLREFSNLFLINFQIYFKYHMQRLNHRQWCQMTMSKRQ